MEQTTSQPNNPTPSRLRGEMMRQVYRVWLFRKLLPVLVVEIIVITVVVYQIGRVVFLQRVVENASNVFFVNPTGIVYFFISAFSEAPFLTKVLAVGLAVFAALIVRHLTQGVLRLILVRSHYFSKIR